MSPTIRTTKPQQQDAEATIGIVDWADMLRKLAAECDAEALIVALIPAGANELPTLLPALGGLLGLAETFIRQALMLARPGPSAPVAMPLPSAGQAEGDAAGRRLILTTGSLDGGEVLAVGLQRRADQPAFRPADRRRLVRQLASFATEAKRRVPQTVASGSAFAPATRLAGIAAALVIVGPDGRIRDASQPARTLLAAGRGLLVKDGIFTAAQPRDAGALASLIARTASGGGTGVVRLQGPGDLVPLVLRATGDAGGVLLRCIDPAAPGAPRDLDLLRLAYGLTRAEAEVAEAAASGQSAVAIAAERQSSEATVRAQIRVVLAKTRTGNLRRLAALVTRFPAMSAMPA